MNDHAAFAIMPVLFCITTVFLHKEIMLLIHIIPCNIQGFAKSLEVYDFPFPQETQGSQNSRVICQIDQVFISRPCFLFCCTFVSVTCYVKQVCLRFYLS